MNLIRIKHCNSSKNNWNSILILPKRAQILAKIVTENNPKIAIMITLFDFNEVILWKANPKWRAVKKR
jgi:hypothetical protein